MSAPRGGNLAAPLANPSFRALWAASLLSNFGTLMHGTAAAWLMTSLTGSPLLVAMVPASLTAASFFALLPAGVIADLYDRRRVLIASQSWMLAVAAAMGAASLAGIITPGLLLAMTFLLGLGAAFTLPSWQAVIQDLVGREHLASAVSLNSISFNLARSVGPAAGGLLTTLAGAGTVFLANAASFSVTLAAIIRIAKGTAAPKAPPAARGALRDSLRQIAEIPPIRNAMARASMHVVCVSSITALLPLFARDTLGLTAEGYGVLLTVFGVGSVTSAILLPRLRARWGIERVVAAYALLASVAAGGLAASGGVWAAAAAVFATGTCWTGVLVNLNVTVQMASDPAMRGRAVAAYFLVFHGSITAGSLVAGSVASATGLRAACWLAAGGLLLSWAAGRRLRLK